MSFEAISSIAQAEAEAKAAVAAAEAKAKQLIADAENAGKLSIEAACADAASKLVQLNHQVTEQAKAQTGILAGELENQKAVMRAKAESRLEQAAALVVERIVNS